MMVGDIDTLQRVSALAAKVADLSSPTAVFLTLTCGETGRPVCVNVAHIAWFETRRHDWNGSVGYRHAEHTRLSLSNGDFVWVREDPALLLRMIQGATGR